MTLPLSGLITMSMINTELGKSSNSPVTLNETAVRFLLAKPSGVISLSDGYGKTGTHWDAQIPMVGDTSLPTCDLRGILWCPSLLLYVAMSVWGEIFTSSTGRTWTYSPDLRIKTMGSGQKFNGLLWTGSTLIASMYYNNCKLYTSPTGVTFTVTTTGPNNPISAACYDSGSAKLVQGCEGGYINYSANMGASWIPFNGTRPGGGFNNLESVASNGTFWLCAGYPDTLTWTPDFIHWTVLVPPSFPISRVFYLNGTWIVTSSAGHLYYGYFLNSMMETSNLKNLFNGDNPNGLQLAWNGSYYLAGGPNGQLAKSTDLVNWTSVGWLASLPGWENVAVGALCWANNKWIAVGQGGGLIAISNAGSQ